MPSASVQASAEVEVYANWALIMVRMTHGSVGADPWTVVQDKFSSRRGRTRIYSSGFVLHEPRIGRKLGNLREAVATFTRRLNFTSRDHRLSQTLGVALITRPCGRDDQAIEHHRNETERRRGIPPFDRPRELNDLYYRERDQVYAARTCVYYRHACFSWRRDRPPVR
jgi:hypothetical protein